MTAAALLNSLGSQIWAIAQVIPGLATYHFEQKKIQNEAVGAMRKALNRTRMFLKSPDFSNNDKLTEISDLWNTASEKVGIFNPQLGEILGEKSRFWSDHELFISLGREKEVMTLNEVVSEIDRLYMKM